MHIAISGASGFVGRQLIWELSGKGHTILRLGRAASGPGERQWDPAAGEPDLRVDPPLDAVVHLAGEPVSQRWNAEVKQKIRDSRVLGTRNLVTALSRLQTPPHVLVSASAVGIYGERGDEWLPETAPPGTGFLAEVCQEWEAEADRAEQAGIRVVKLRIGLVLGKQGGALAKMLLPFRLGLGARLGDGSQYMSWIHLEDLTAMIRFALATESARGVWNGVAPGPVTNTVFTRELGRAVHRPAWFWAPKPLIMLGAGEMAQILFFSQRCTPDSALGAGFRFQFTGLGAALRSVVS